LSLHPETIGFVGVSHWSEVSEVKWTEIDSGKEKRNTSCFSRGKISFANSASLLHYGSCSYNNMAFTSEAASEARLNSEAISATYSPIQKNLVA
jgi:hypothetical protein